MTGVTPTFRFYASIGDSLSEGIGDPGPDGALRGWAARLAERLREDSPRMEFLKIGVRGLLTAEIRDRQLEHARRYHPDLVSIVVGGNDVLAPGRFDVALVETDLDALVAAFAADAVVLMATLPRFGPVRPWMPRRPTDLRARLDAVNDVIRRVAARHGARLLELEDHPAMRHPALWSFDGLHPSAYGHALMADGFAALLGLPPRQPVPPGPVARMRATVEQVRWTTPVALAFLRRHLHSPHFRRRSIPRSDGR
jgi:lysophospholipase L1-like esterase